MQKQSNKTLKESTVKKPVTIFIILLFLLISFNAALFLIIIAIKENTENVYPDIKRETRELKPIDFITFDNRSISTENLKMITVEEECDKVLGIVVHQIKNKGVCKVRCTYECDFINGTLYDFEFDEEDLICNKCDCYCVDNSVSD